MCSAGQGIVDKCCQSEGRMTRSGSKACEAPEKMSTHLEVEKQLVPWPSVHPSHGVLTSKPVRK